MPALIFLAFLVWVLWASFSSGGLYELKQINPEYPHPNKNVAYLVSKLQYSASGYWDNVHVENCSLHMPNWEKAERCVRARISCELGAPKGEGLDGKSADIFSNKFRACWDDRRPSLGPMEWVRFSRGALRSGIIIGGMWLTEGLGGEGESWDEENRWWAEPLLGWFEKGT
jgi:hypothetical protein